MGTRVYVGNLDPNVQKDELIDICNAYGKLADVWVARNPPGFAFVTFEDTNDAEDCVRALVDRKIGNQAVRAELARNRSGGPSGGGGKGKGKGKGGGYGDRGGHDRRDDRGYNDRRDDRGYDRRDDRGYDRRDRDIDRRDRDYDRRDRDYDRRDSRGRDDRDDDRRRDDRGGQDRRGEDRRRFRDDDNNDKEE